MRRALTKLLPEDHRSIEKRSYNRGIMTCDRSIKTYVVRFDRFDSVANGDVAYCRCAWGVFSFVGGSFHCVTSF